MEEAEKKDTEAPAQESVAEPKGMFDEMFTILSEREKRRNAMFHHEDKKITNN